MNVRHQHKFEDQQRRKAPLKLHSFWLLVCTALIALGSATYSLNVFAWLTFAATIGAILIFYSEHIPEKTKARQYWEELNKKQRGA